MCIAACSNNKCRPAQHHQRAELAQQLDPWLPFPPACLQACWSPRAPLWWARASTTQVRGPCNSQTGRPAHAHYASFESLTETAGSGRQQPPTALRSHPASPPVPPASRPALPGRPVCDLCAPRRLHHPCRGARVHPGRRRHPVPVGCACTLQYVHIDKPFCTCLNPDTARLHTCLTACLALHCNRCCRPAGRCCPTPCLSRNTCLAACRHYPLLPQACPMAPASSPSWAWCLSAMPWRRSTWSCLPLAAPDPLPVSTCNWL